MIVVSLDPSLIVLFIISTPTDSDQDHLSLTLNDGCILLNPSYSQSVHPAADSDVEFETNLKSDAASDSGWDADLDSDSDTPRPVPAVQLTTTRRGRLTFQDRLIHWRPSVLDNYIKFRVYFRGWKQGYTFLVAENLLQVLSPVSQQFTPQLFVLTSIACISASASGLFTYTLSGKLGKSKEVFGFLQDIN